MNIDLHTHSTASDGIMSPPDLVQAAGAAGLSAIALTDHDTTDGLLEALQAGEEFGIEVVPGIEINTDLPGGQAEAHILGYFLRWNDSDFQAQLTELRAARERRALKRIDQLRALGLPISWEQVQALASGPVGTPHIARALIQMGAVSSVAEARERYLRRGAPGYVPRETFSAEEAIKLIRSVGGVPALAHPAGIQGLSALLPTLKGDGLAGLEVYYGKYDDDTISSLLLLAQDSGLIPTGGSDFHGAGIQPTPLGERQVPIEVLEELRALARLG